MRSRFGLASVTLSAVATIEGGGGGGAGAFGALGVAIGVSGLAIGVSGFTAFAAFFGAGGGGFFFMESTVSQTFTDLTPGPFSLRFRHSGGARNAQEQGEETAG